MSNKKKDLMVVTELPSAIDNLALLKQELKELRTITETQYKTEGVIAGFPTAIQNETNIMTLVSMHSSVMGKRNAYNASQDTISARLGGTTVPVFKMSGYSPEAIEDDIVLRIQVLSVEERKKVLEELVKEGEKFLTEKDQYAIYQRKVAEIVGRK